MQLGRRSLRVLGALLLTAGLCACGARPQPGPQQALYGDLRALVIHEQRTDWIADRVEIAELAPRLLFSGCQVPAEDRQALQAWLATQIAAEGGPAAEAFKANGGQLSPLKELLLMERVAASLAYIEAHAAADCPFWLPPDPAFSGVQANQGRFVILAESMGGAQLVRREGQTAIGGAGSGRLLGGFGLSSRFTVATGIELGGASTFPKDADGNRSVKPAWAYGLPALLRIHAGSWRFDTELAATARAAFEDPSDLRFGARIAQAAGVTTPRVAGVMPYIMLWIGHEWLPGGDGLDSVQILRAGTRVGINWAP